MQKRIVDVIPLEITWFTFIWLTLFLTTGYEHVKKTWQWHNTGLAAFYQGHYLNNFDRLYLTLWSIYFIWSDAKTLKEITAAKILPSRQWAISKAVTVLNINFNQSINTKNVLPCLQNIRDLQSHRWDRQNIQTHI